MLKIKPESVKVINDPRSSLVQRQKDDESVRMLYILPNGKQKLITFQVPDENCTVQELLQQANISLSSNTRVSLIEDASSLNINYVTEVGEESEICPENYTDDENDDDDVNLGDDRNSSHLSLDEVAANESDSSDIFRLTEKTKDRFSMTRRKIDHDVHEVLQSEENEVSRDFEEAKTEDRSMANISFAKNLGSRKEYEMRNMTEDSAVLPTQTFFTCRAVILGSYYCIPEGSVTVSESGIKMKVPDPEEGTNFHFVELKFEEVLKILVNYGNEIPVLFVWSLSLVGRRIRKQLGMHDPNGLYYDPVGSDDKHRRLTLLPEVINEESKQILIKLFKPKKVIEELNINAAYNILKKATPKNIWPQLKMTLKKSVKAIESNGDSSTSDGRRAKVVKSVTKLPEKMIELSEESTSKVTDVKNKTRKILVFPPQPAVGGISINTEDYACLKEGEFLNDTIIDFYLIYLTLEILSIEDRNRTHVFSSHFYTRLTSKQHSVGESDPSLSSAAQRHAKVCKWTKDVNIFEKDFIIVPIVKDAHWFLAVICFPNLVGIVEENAIKFSRERRVKQRNKKLQTVATTSEEGMKKSPCILIFDSLAGTANQNRVAAKLRDYLTHEHLAKIGTRKVFSNTTIEVSSPKVPQQSNCSDCGIYVLQYVESFFNDPIEDYTLPIKTLEYWFEESVVTQKRNKLAKLIKKLAIK